MVEGRRSSRENVRRFGPRLDSNGDANGSKPFIGVNGRSAAAGRPPTDGGARDVRIGTPRLR
jgi:hypothetical protein